MADPITQPRLLKLHDLAELLGVPDGAVLGMARSGELPAVRIGKRDPWRVDRRRLEERLDEFKIKSATWVQTQGTTKAPGASSSKRSESRAAVLTRKGRTPPPTEFMTVGEAAELLGVSWPTVINRIKDGTFEASKSKRRWLVRAADVEAAVLQKKVARLLAKRARRQARVQR